MLLLVSLGLSVVRDNLGPTLRKAQLLSVAHFIFGGDTSAFLVAAFQLSFFFQSCMLWAS
jgi:hypothetical protein